MKTPTAFQFLSTFSTSDLNRFSKFLNSSAFNKQEAYFLLFKEWKKNRGKAINRRAIFAKVLPHKPYLDRDWHLLMSRFQNKIDQYLIWQEIQKNELAASPFLMKAIRRLQKQQLFKVSTNKFRRLQEKQKVYPASNLFRAYELEMEYYDFIASHNRTETTNLQIVTDTLDHHFIAEKLKHACLAHSRLITNDEQYHIQYLKAILADIECRPILLNIPAIAVYKACYDAVVAQGTEKDFKHLRNIIDQYGAGFSNAEIRDIYLLAINYCIKAMNESKIGFEQIAFIIYQDCLDKGYLLEDGYFPESTFSNMVALGIKRQAFDWTVDFIQTQKVFLKEDIRSSLVGFNQAQLFYAQGKLLEATNALVLVSTKSPFLYLGAKSLLLKVLYEAQEWDALDSSLDSLRVYLQRRKDLGYRREHYRLLHYFFKQLIQLKPTDREAREKLKQEIILADAFRMKEWFFARLGYSSYDLES